MSFGHGMMGGRGFHRMAGRGGEDDFTQGKNVRMSRLLSYLKPHRCRIFFTLIVSLSVTGLNLIPPKVIGMIIDRALGGRDMRLLVTYAAILVTVYISSAALNGVRGYSLGRVGQMVIYDLWQHLYRSLQRQSFSFYDATQTGNLMSRMTNDVTAVERVIVEGVDQVVIATMTLIGISIILFRTNWHLALVTMAPIPILGFLAWFATHRAHAIYREVRMRMGEVSALVQDALSGIREVQSFSRENYEAERLAEKSSQYITANLQAIRFWSVLSPTVIATTSMGTFLVLFYGGQMVIRGSDLTVGGLVSFLFYLGLFYQPIHLLNHFNHMLQHARASGERIFEVIDAVPVIRESPQALSLPRPVSGEVIFHNVRFSYKAGEEVLHGISFEARPGELIALVGPTGAGKTTIVSLIPRFYDVDSGAVLIDGIDVRKLKLRELREHIGIVMQEPFLFNASVMENIAYGRLNATMDEIVRVAKLANAHDFIMALPDKYDHQIGERGIKLSVGEKQRIAIARALLKDPPILILDEATSSVDNRTEALIQEAIEHLLRNRTSLVIAHRLSTVMHADKILVIKDGRIVESGTHATLLQQGGLYRTLYEVQWRHREKERALFNAQDNNGKPA